MGSRSEKAPPEGVSETPPSSLLLSTMSGAQKGDKRRRGDQTLLLSQDHPARKTELKLFLQFPQVVVTPRRDQPRLGQLGLHKTCAGQNGGHQRGVARGHLTWGFECTTPSRIQRFRIKKENVSIIYTFTACLYNLLNLFGN